MSKLFDVKQKESYNLGFDDAVDAVLEIVNDYEKLTPAEFVEKWGSTNLGVVMRKQLQIAREQPAQEERSE